MLFERYEAVSPAVRVAANTLLLVILHIVNGLQCWALSGLYYLTLSSRWLHMHRILIHGAVTFASLYATVSIARYSIRITTDRAIDSEMKYSRTAWTWK